MRASGRRCTTTQAATPSQRSARSVDSVMPRETNSPLLRSNAAACAEPAAESAGSTANTENVESAMEAIASIASASGRAV